MVLGSKNSDQGSSGSLGMNVPSIVDDPAMGTIKFKTTEFKEFGCRFTEINEFFSKFYYVNMTKVTKCWIIV
jgi:hypothetical protein